MVFVIESLSREGHIEPVDPTLLGLLLAPVVAGCGLHIGVTHLACNRYPRTHGFGSLANTPKENAADHGSQILMISMPLSAMLITA